VRHGASDILSSHTATYDWKIASSRHKERFEQSYYEKARYMLAKLAELCLVVKPDLIIMNARKVFIRGAPSKGEIRKPNLILASGNKVAIDVENMKILQSYPGNSLKKEHMDLVQIKHAVDLGLRPRNKGEYEIIAPRI
jgi:uncharacterized protein (DUF362 family)